MKALPTTGQRGNDLRRELLSLPGSKADISIAPYVLSRPVQVKILTYNTQAQEDSWRELWITHIWPNCADDNQAPGLVFWTIKDYRIIKG